MVNREIVGTVQRYKNRSITVRFIGPDLLCYVDAQELPNFFSSSEGARKAAMRYIDHVEKEKRAK